MVKDPELDVVYIATPHTFHKPHALLCLNNGKAVFVKNLLALMPEKLKKWCNVLKQSFLMEAMDSFLPVMYKVKEWITNEAIGEEC